ncbi:unnamed protein product [Linum tenue]|uniref:Uncharacterized protein n=1 Tax=Linum tenue TaxID=586396 RepID=A0AAV0LNX6_9ROSI|nr:unnamed protein product [Linum tenue]
MLAEIENMQLVANTVEGQDHGESDPVIIVSAEEADSILLAFKAIPTVSIYERGDLKPGAEVSITGPVGKEMLMQKDPNATIVMLATGSGIAPLISFLWKMFFESMRTTRLRWHVLHKVDDLEETLWILLELKPLFSFEIMPLIANC